MTVDWATLAAWIGLLLTAILAVGKVLARDMARIEQSVDKLDSRVRDDSALSDERIRTSVLALDTRLQNEIRMLIEASHLRLTALEARNNDLDRELRAISKRRGLGNE